MTSIGQASSTHNTETTASLGNGDVLREVTSREHPEGDVEEEEDEEERDRRAEGAEEENESDDPVERLVADRTDITREPSAMACSPMHGYSRPHAQEDAESVVKLLLGLVRGEDLELRNVETTEGDPERAVRREGSSTESVTAGPLLNTSDELGKTAVTESETEDDIGGVDATSLSVVEGEDESGTAETETRQC